MDMAVGIIIGVAFGKIITSFVNDVLMPPIGLLLGKVDFSKLFISLSSQSFATLEEAKKAGVVTINYGSFLNTVIDFLIVAFHWGAEYVKYPAAETRQLAYDAIDSGADLIAGNHPHWIQPIEVFKDKLIIYAHGNFIFDQEWSEETKTGIIVKTYMSGGKIADAEVIPIYISNFNQPEILTGKKKEAVLNLVREISTQLVTSLDNFPDIGY